jgi:hypothetical protein
VLFSTSAYVCVAPLRASMFEELPLDFGRGSSGIVGAWVQTWYWWLVIVLASIYLPLLFPDGRLPSWRWLPVAILPGIGTQRRDRPGRLERRVSISSEADGAACAEVSLWLRPDPAAKSGGSEETGEQHH